MKMKSSLKGTALSYATKYGSVDCVRRLLKAGAEVNICNEDGHTPLSIASYTGKAKLFDMLLETGADMKMKNILGRTALSYAAKYGSVDCVRRLLKAGADVNMCTKYGHTALSIAACTGEAEIFDMLLEAGADVNVCNEDGCSLLVTVASGGHINAINMLIKAGADVNKADNGGNTLLMKAARDFLYTKYFSLTSSVMYLLRAGAHVNRKNQKGENSFPPEGTLADVVMLLLAAGELPNKSPLKVWDRNLEKYVEINVSDMRKTEDMKQLCREAVRNHLLRTSSVNLVYRIRRVGFSHEFSKFLLHNIPQADKILQSRKKQESR